MKKVAFLLISALMVLTLSTSGVFADDTAAPAPVETTDGGHGSGEGSGSEKAE